MIHFPFAERLIQRSKIRRKW